MFSFFNLRRDKFAENVKGSFGKKFRYHYLKEEKPYTRYIDTIAGEEKSYLDYFQTKDVGKVHFNIVEGLDVKGRSDHLALELLSDDKVCQTETITKQLVYRFD